MPKPKDHTLSRVSRQALLLLGQQSKAGRLARKLTAEDLATRAGISRALLRRIERSTDTLRLLHKTVRPPRPEPRDDF